MHDDDYEEYVSPHALPRKAVEGVTGGNYEYLAGASNDPEGNATEAWLESRAQPEEEHHADQG